MKPWQKTCPNDHVGMYGGGLTCPVCHGYHVVPMTTSEMMYALTKSSNRKWYLQPWRTGYAVVFFGRMDGEVLGETPDKALRLALEATND